MDFSIREGPGTNLPRIPRDDCNLFDGRLYPGFNSNLKITKVTAISTSPGEFILLVKFFRERSGILYFRI